jgi:2-aminoadipate transaminase
LFVESVGERCLLSGKTEYIATEIRIESQTTSVYQIQQIAVQRNVSQAYSQERIGMEGMESFFADRITAVPRSFIREILKVSLDPQIISFAGGLPNKKYFPLRQIQAASAEVFDRFGADVLQYSNSEGLLELRQQIATRYKEKKGLDISAENILITNGSQQGLDLLGKALLNEGDGVLIEEPGYLGAIQSMSVYRPEFLPVAVQEGGVDVGALEEKSNSRRVKMFYTVPNFQNPSGVTYSETTRQRVAAIAEKNGFLLIEDDPYGELRFKGTAKRSLYAYLPQQTVLLGSFSKTVAPGFRVGWIVAPAPLYEKLLVAKQAADLHTSSVNQHVLSEYLRKNDLDEHLQIIIDAYGRQCRSMVEMAGLHLPERIELVVPEGGMFLWGRLPKGYNSMDLFEHAVRHKVVFVPGAPFYTDGTGLSTFRLSFSCTEPEVIDNGMRRLAQAFAAYELQLGM